MDPIQINITVDLGARTLEVIKSFSGRTGKEAEPARPKPAAMEVKEAPAPAAPSTPEPVAKEPEPVADKPKEITDEALRALIKDIRTRKSPAEVRQVFADFGIKTSIECPQERRADLVARLNKLVA